MYCQTAQSKQGFIRALPESNSVSDNIVLNTFKYPAQYDDKDENFALFKICDFKQYLPTEGADCSAYATVLANELDTMLEAQSRI